MILDEDPAFCRIYQSIFERAGYHVLMSSGRKSGLELLKKENPQAVFIEIRINGSPAEGLCFIEEALRERPNLTIIVVSNIGGCDARSRALDRGATEYVVKSSPDEIESHIQKIVQKIDCEIRLKEAVEKDGGLDIGSGRKFIGKSPDMWRVYRLIQKVAENRSSALILGETGTGKELIARAIHAWKKERTPFVSINCGFLTKTLLESQLFGVCKDYPGLHNYKKKLIGKLETVSDGMLLLDEIGNMDMDLQVSLLRVLQEKEFCPIGDEKPLPFRAQVVASTNVDLKSAIDAGRFRNDLYYRLNVVSIVLPPLHQRKEDIPLLVGYYLEQHEKQFGRRVVLPQAMDKLIEYHWPGNIRELFNALERVLTTYSSPDLAPGYFDFLLSKPIEERKTDATVQDDIAFGDLSRQVESYEKKVLLRTLEASEWNQTKTAEKLKLTRTNLIWKMKKYGLLRKRLMA
jgi:DNA-binding NtrC family response regulator